MRVMLASLAALVVVGCGPAREEAASGPDARDPGVIVFSGGWYFGQQSGDSGYHEMRPDGTGVRKLAFGDEELVTLSPDGRFVASVVTSYEDDKEWGDDLVFVSRLDGSERRLVPLPNGPNDGVLFASVSPGGKNLALAYRPDMFDDPRGVWTASVSGDDFEQQTSIGNVQTAAWAPDGQHLVVMDEPRDEDGGYDGNGDIYVMQADGSDLHRVARGSDPVWSPDGEHIAFADNDRNVSIVDGTGENLRVVVRNGRSPVWSPDGKRLAFLRGLSAATPSATRGFSSSTQEVAWRAGSGPH